MPLTLVELTTSFFAILVTLSPFPIVRFNIWREGTKTLFFRLLPLAVVCTKGLTESNSSATTSHHKTDLHYFIRIHCSKDFAATQGFFIKLRLRQVFYNFIDNAIFFSLFGRHPKVALHILANFLWLLFSSIRHNLN